MSITFRMTVNSGWRDEVDQAASSYIDKLALAIESDAKRFVPVDDGNLIGAIYKESDGLTLRVGVRNVIYWRAIEYGGKSYTITARNKKALFWPGARHPVRAVEHPATPAQPFLRPALYKRRGAL
ncbi:hypothetical protein ACFWPV_09825 [Streptomyces uncialis]|uniref:hypothetical protein n=1 Tax=Streptomyces uncialis TaxID=1048205 RepID=UPI00365FEB05